MEETNVVYSNPVRIDENIIQVDKGCKLVINISNMMADKANYEMYLSKITNLISNVQALL